MKDYYVDAITALRDGTYEGFSETLDNELIVARMVGELRQFQGSELPAIGLPALRRCGKFSEAEIERFGAEAMRTVFLFRKGK